MDTITFDQLLLQTAFCCMACDGHVDTKELDLIKSICSESPLFNGFHIESEINSLLTRINSEGKDFIKSYFSLLNISKLTEKEEEKIIEFAIKTIEADEKVEYSEVKFLKIIQSHLNISKDRVIELFPQVEYYLEDDIVKDLYMDRLVNQYFDTVELPIFDHIKISNQ